MPTNGSFGWDADARLLKVAEELRKALEERFLDKLSPAQKKFYALCQSVNKGMSEQEVDSIFTGYPRKRLSKQLDDGQYMKAYDEKAGAGEGEYVFDVTFDAEHRVVSVYFTEYLK